MTINVRLPPKPPPVSPSDSIREFLSHIPSYVFLLIGMVIVAAIVGSAAGQLMKKKRRARLFIEVEKAEKERERRHTMEIHDDDPLGLPRSRPATGPGGHEGAHTAAADHPSDLMTHPANMQSQPDVSWQDQVHSRPEHSRPDFGGVKVIERPAEEEVVYVTEVGAPVPIWATTGKKKEPAVAPRQSPTIHHQPPQNRSRPEPQAQPSSEEDLQRILKKIEEVKKH
jgi:FtsZ-interacting cell division protein ZipA